MNDAFKKIVILTGAGVSEESGIQTFRGANGIWNSYPIEEVASPKAFLENPKLVHEFYNFRRNKLLEEGIRPNRAHEVIAELEREYKQNFTLITQNVDNLHERAGSQNIIHMHGELLKMRCTKCKNVNYCDFELGIASRCPNCHQNNCLRPDIVWFGEFPKRLDDCYQALRDCDLFISIGTSGNVYPAAAFVDRVPLGCTKVEINLESTITSHNFDLHFYGKASKVLEEVVYEDLSLI